MAVRAPRANPCGCGRGKAAGTEGESGLPGLSGRTGAGCAARAPRATRSPSSSQDPFRHGSGWIPSSQWRAGLRATHSPALGPLLPGSHLGWDSVERRGCPLARRSTLGGACAGPTGYMDLSEAPSQGARVKVTHSPVQGPHWIRARRVLPGSQSPGAAACPHCSSGQTPVPCQARPRDTECHERGARPGTHIPAGRTEGERAPEATLACSKTDGQDKAFLPAALGAPRENRESRAYLRPHTRALCRRPAWTSVGNVATGEKGYLAIELTHPHPKLNEAERCHHPACSHTNPTCHASGHTGAGNGTSAALQAQCYPPLPHQHARCTSRQQGKQGNVDGNKTASSLQGKGHARWATLSSPVRLGAGASGH